MPEPERKWLSLYVTRLAQLPPVQWAKPAASNDDDDEPPRTSVLDLPDSVLRSIFTRLDDVSLACAAQACITWRAVAYEPSLWRSLAERAYPSTPRARMERCLWTAPAPGPYLTWRRLLTRMPRVRNGGVYVQRSRYVKPRSAMVDADGSCGPPVFLVVYWRMLRFFPDGRVLALLTPDAPEKAYKRLLKGWQPVHGDAKKVRPTVGNYVFSEASRHVEVNLPIHNEMYPNALGGFQQMILNLWETHTGAFNRMHQIDSYAIMNDGSSVSYQESMPGVRYSNAFKFVRLHGFGERVYHHFPPETHLNGRPIDSFAEGKYADRARTKQL